MALFIGFGSIKIYSKMHHTLRGSIVYNELLLVLMGFMALLMIVMAVVVSSQRRRPKVQPEVEEEKVEKIFVEKGFENHVEEPIEESEELEEANYEPVFIDEKPAEPEYEEPQEYIEEPEPPVYSEPEPVLEEPTDEPESPAYFDPEPVHDESVEITPIEPIIIETEYKEPEYEKIMENVPAEPIIEPEVLEPNYIEPAIYDVPDVSEPDESVVITPNQTFYDPVPEEQEQKAIPTIEESPPLIEDIIEPEERPIEDIPEIELSPLEPDKPTPVPDEIEPDIEEEPIPEPVIKPKPRTRKSRIRKPVIDESDPDLKIGLGVETCPHCCSKVPDTIYCIYCGKSLNPNNTVEQKEEENLG